MTIKESSREYKLKRDWLCRLRSWLTFADERLRRRELGTGNCILDQ